MGVADIICILAEKILSWQRARYLLSIIVAFSLTGVGKFKRPTIWHGVMFAYLIYGITGVSRA